VTERRTKELSVAQVAVMVLLLAAPLAIIIGKAPALPTSACLTHWCSLEFLPKEAHAGAGHILFVPLGAVLVVLARLTFGIRVLGPFRAVLLAVAFQVTGLLWGLVFLAVIIGIILLLRPTVSGSTRPAIPSSWRSTRWPRWVPAVRSCWRPRAEASNLSRFATKALVYEPGRFEDAELPGLFERIIAAGKTPVIVLHVDHPSELSAEARAHILRLRATGVQFLHQAVLLKGVNDNPPVLARLFAEMHAIGVRPPDQAGHVFDRFWRGDTSRTATGVHCGLGLSLVERAIHILGGSVTAAARDGRFIVCVMIPVD